MPTLIFGVLVLVLVLWALNVISKVDPQDRRARAQGRRRHRWRSALRCFSACAAKSASPFRSALFGLGLLGWLPFGPAGLFARARRRARGQVSRVRSAFLEMELDHDSGAMRGRILAGRHQGAALDALDVTTLVGLLDEIDEESRALLVAYLDRRDARLA